MESESVVYGCIRDWPATDPLTDRMRRASNWRVLQALDGPFLCRGMFSACAAGSEGLYQSQVLHFGASYRTVEYEWNLWVRDFERLLQQLYWSGAVVHLSTELNGLHTFRWSAEGGLHHPKSSQLQMRCVWERETG